MYAKADVSPQTSAVLRGEHISEREAQEKGSPPGGGGGGGGGGESEHPVTDDQEKRSMQSQVKVTASRDARNSVKATPIGYVY